MAKLIFTAFVSLFLFGCAAPLTVDKLQDFIPSSKIIVLLESTRFDVKIRKALAKQGFKTLKFSTLNRVVSEGNEGEIARLYNEAEARYGLTFYWEPLDRCVVNASKKINGTFEISDLKTNEVLLIIEQGGWSDDCAYHEGTLFNDLAKSLRDNWNN
ncbi:MAG: hypothetical protein RPS47_04960 [Colwellia sp.]